MSASWLRILGLMITSSWLLVGCSSAKKIDVGGACILNSDCNSPLVCTAGKCHDACHTTADCPTGQSCITASDQSKVCQLPSETHCAYNSDCQPELTCGADQRCRNQCQKDIDCTSGQTCTTTGTCAEPNQVDSNKNLIPADGGVGASGGASGGGDAASCPMGAETCSCYPNDTCNAGLTCASHLCVRFGAGGGAGGTGNTGGTGGTASTGGATAAGGTDAGTVIGTSGMGGTTGPVGNGGAGSGTTGSSAGDGTLCPSPQQVITDFTYTPSDAGTTSTTEVRFGSSGMLQGGIAYYPSLTTDSYPLTLDLTQGNYHLSGTVGGYSGFMLYYDNCDRLDASKFEGISFTISGSVPQGNAILFGMGTVNDTPTGAWMLQSGKTTAKATDAGRCIPTSGNQYYHPGCVDPSTQIPVTSTPTKQSVYWANFTGGAPEPSVTPTGITLIFWNIPWSGSGATPYQVDLVLDDLEFIP